MLRKNPNELFVILLANAILQCVVFMQLLSKCILLVIRQVLNIERIFDLLVSFTLIWEILKELSERRKMTDDDIPLI